MSRHHTPPAYSAIVDYSHMGRKITGIERVSAELFSAEALAGLNTLHSPEATSIGMIREQWLNLPRLAAKHLHAKLLFPGFPPSIAMSMIYGSRVIPYIHDLFLLDRVSELNIRARVYMRPSFIYAIRQLTQFFVNSKTTEQALRKECKPNATIMTLRPRAENVFGFTEKERQLPALGKLLRFVMLGTLEPRKNYEFAAKVTAELARTSGRPVELHISGREGWGNIAEKLKSFAHVHYHGYLSVSAVRQLVNESDIFLCTSLDEGLGLPLLEALFSGIPMVVSDIPVFREVSSLASTTFISNTNLAAATEEIQATLAAPHYFSQSISKARLATKTWNQLADTDKQNFRAFMVTPK